uniref:CA domain-containing protein n=1 Tax=Macrostomum lignano TaxID=282301 RepID=A0A1I8JMB7_9PLAT
VETSMTMLQISSSPVPSAPVVSVLRISHRPFCLIDITDKDVDERNRSLELRCAGRVRSAPEQASGGHRDNPSECDIPENIRPLDRKRRLEYACAHSAGLSALANIPIESQDVNDSRRDFWKSPRDDQVSENQPAGTVNLAACAQDEDEGENALTVYQVKVSDQCFPYLGIGATKRQPVHSSLIRPRAQLQHRPCTVTAHDARKPELSAAIGVRIDIKDQNDCSPVFLGTQSGNFTFKVPENSQFGSLIGQLVCQGQRRRRQWSVLPDGGIKLVARQLDRERSDSHRLFVKAMDHGIPPRWTTAEVLIQVLDENDNSPRFLFPSNRNSTLNGAELAMISADDADFGDNGRLCTASWAPLTPTSLLSTTNTVSMPFCDVSLFHLNPSSGLLVLRQIATNSFCRQSRLQTDGARRGTPGRWLRLDGAASRGTQVETPDWTARQRQPALTTRGAVTVCVGLSFLVLLCVVLLLAYFCYYLQPPGQAAAEDPQDGGGPWRRRVPTCDRGTDWREGGRNGGLIPNHPARMAGEAGTWRRFQQQPAVISTTPTIPDAEHRSDRTMGGRGFISMPVRPPQALLKSAATDESDDEFATAGLQYFANRHSSVKQSGYYQRPRYQQNQMQRRNSEDSDVASAMLPQYAAAAADAFDTDLEIGANSKTSFFRGGLGRLNSMSSEGAKNGSFPESYYKSLRPPSNGAYKTQMARHARTAAANFATRRNAISSSDSQSEVSK